MTVGVRNRPMGVFDKRHPRNVYQKAESAIDDDMDDDTILEDDASMNSTGFVLGDDCTRAGVPADFCDYTYRWQQELNEALHEWGFIPDEVFQHISKLFQPDSRWRNYGDHVSEIRQKAMYMGRVAGAQQGRRIPIAVNDSTGSPSLLEASKDSSLLAVSKLKVPETRAAKSSRPPKAPRPSTERRTRPPSPTKKRGNDMKASSRKPPKLLIQTSSPTSNKKQEESIEIETSPTQLTSDSKKSMPTDSKGSRTTTLCDLKEVPTRTDSQISATLSNEEISAALSNEETEVVKARWKKNYQKLQRKQSQDTTDGSILEAASSSVMRLFRVGKYGEDAEVASSPPPLFRACSSASMMTSRSVAAASVHNNNNNKVKDDTPEASKAVTPATPTTTTPTKPTLTASE